MFLCFCTYDYYKLYYEYMKNYLQEYQEQRLSILNNHNGMKLAGRQSSSSSSSSSEGTKRSFSSRKLAIFLLIVAPTNKPNITLLTTPRKLNGVLFGSGRIAPDGVVIVDRRNGFDIVFVFLRTVLPRNNSVTLLNSILFLRSLFPMTINRFLSRNSRTGTTQ